jgi:carbonic anhydrase
MKRLHRRDFFMSAIGACALGRSLAAAGQFVPKGNGALTKTNRDSLTPAQVIAELKKGNDRFRAGRPAPRDYLEEQHALADGQAPAAVILGCIDSRVPAEIVFDAGIGDLFVARIAGNVVDEDVVGSLEYACAEAGAKVVVVLGHTDCGAVKGAIEDLKLGSLTGLLSKLKPAIAATSYGGEKSEQDRAYVAAVSRTNVALGLKNVRSRSTELSALETRKTIQIVGALYDVTTGAVTFIS